MEFPPSRSIATPDQNLQASRGPHKAPPGDGFAENPPCGSRTRNTRRFATLRVRGLRIGMPMSTYFCVDIDPPAEFCTEMDSSSCSTLSFMPLMWELSSARTYGKGRQRRHKPIREKESVKSLEGLEHLAALTENRL
jgi:hypothetical protein